MTFRFRALLVSASLAASLLAGPAFSQNVAYTGSLRIGVSDAVNTIGFRSNNAIPICAGQGSLVNPGTIGTLAGNLPINAGGSGGSGVGAPLTFRAVNPVDGGAQERTFDTCNVAIPGFLNPRLRSRTQVGSAQWPGRKGPHTSMISMAPLPTTIPTYMISAGGGNPNPVTVNTWTTTIAPGEAPIVYFGSAFSGTAPFLGGEGRIRIQPGPARYGGGIPFSGSGGVQLGINLCTSCWPQKLVPGDYGKVSYVNGFLPIGPQFFGTDAKGVHVVDAVTNTVITPSYTNPIGLIRGRQNWTYAGRTPGGSTQYQSGALLTVGGGNTQTPLDTPPPWRPDTITPFGCVISDPGPCLAVISDVAGTQWFNEWTTGMVTWTDMVGDFYTIRRASGFDVAVNPSSAISGETRHIQLVSPWGATVRPVGPWGLPVPTLGFGGVAILELRVIPVPEPSAGWLLSVGAIASLGLRGRR